MTAAMQWVADKFRSAGLHTETIETSGHPMVYAETPMPPTGDGSRPPVVLVYGHYDVQPPEPLADWTTPPFEPDVRDGNVYARGATDDKGQVLTHIHAVCDWMRQIRSNATDANASLPNIQIKFLIEGEEEIGSGSLEAMLPDLRDKLDCDCVVISDSSQYADGQPAITYGLRGIATYELIVRGPDQDLHSGSFGGAVMNPAIALSKILASMVDQNGRITIDGFYDDVVDISAAERSRWESLPSDDRQFATAIGVDELFGEQGYTTDQRRWARPTFDVNGITAGHQGEGVKTIIPAFASAKFSFRLVPGQDPAKITEGVGRHIESVLPTGVRFELQPDHGAPAMLADRDSPMMSAAAAAIESAFGTAPVMIREGGSIPIVARLQSVLDCDCLLLGWGLSDDNCHSPNEKFRVADFYRGIAASRQLWHEIAKQPSGPELRRTNR